MIRICNGHKMIIALAISDTSFVSNITLMMRRLKDRSRNPRMANFLLSVLGVLGAVVLFKLMTGVVSLNGLLTSDGAHTDPERVQALMSTLTAVFIYTGMALANIENKKYELPDPSAVFMGSFAGSQALYLVGKFVRRSE